MTMERANTIAEMIKEQGIEAIAQEVRKGDEVRIGITMGSDNIKPTIYPDLDMTDEEIVEDVIVKYHQAKVDNFDINQITDYNIAKEHLQLCLRRPTSDECKDTKRKFLDMEMYVRVVIPEMTGMDTMGSVIVKSDLLNVWNITEDELFEYAKAVTETEIVIKTMKDTMREMIITNMSEEERYAMELMIDSMPDDDEMFVISNKSKMHGAGALVIVDKIKEIAERVESDLIIIPSSIHELIAHPTKTGLTLKEASAMVRDVNETQVVPNEQLSDHAYYFNREVNEFIF